MGWTENAVYPGIPETLSKLQQAGVRLHVATSKPEVYARRIIEHFRLGDFFHGVFGAELDGTRSNKTELLRYALSVTSPRASTVVGDREHDCVGASNNGLDFIGVLYGYGSFEELRDAGAEHVVEAPEGLVSLLLHP